MLKDGSSGVLRPGVLLTQPGTEHGAWSGSTPATDGVESAVRNLPCHSRCTPATRASPVRGGSVGFSAGLFINWVSRHSGTHL